MRTRLILLLWACLTTGICSALLPASAQPLPAPVNKAQLTHPFAAYGTVKPGKYHTGVDFSPLTQSYAERRQHPVRAVQDGRVTLIYGLRRSDGKWYVRWWDAETRTYRWVTGVPYVRQESSHGLGICVVLEHKGLPRVYTLYAQLDAVRANLKVGDFVRRGKAIGLVGNSGQDAREKDYLRLCPAQAHEHSTECLKGVEEQELVVSQEGGFSPHLHFEVKYQPVPGDGSRLPGRGEAGYTAYDPLYPPPGGKSPVYIDPLLWLHQAQPLKSSSVQIVSASVSAHIGPGDYLQCASLRSGQQFQAVASALSNYPTDGARWYLVEAKDGSLFAYPGGGEIPRVWICEGLPGQRWVELSGPPDIRMFISAHPASPTPLEKVTVRVRAWNAGGNKAVLLTIRCEIPAHTSYVPGSLQLDEKPLPDPEIKDGQFDVSIPLLEPRQEVLITYQVRVQ